MVVLRKLAVGIAAALATGLVVGGVARLMMRLATLAAGQEGSFTVGGTASIMATFAIFTLPGAALAALTRRRGRSALLIAAALILCVPAASIAGSDLSGVGGLSVLGWVGVGMATAGVFAAILAIPFVVLRLVDAGVGGSALAQGVDPAEPVSPTPT